MIGAGMRDPLVADERALIGCIVTQRIVAQRIVANRVVTDVRAGAVHLMVKSALRAAAPCPPFKK